MARIWTCRFCYRSQRIDATDPSERRFRGEFHGDPDTARTCRNIDCLNSIEGLRALAGAVTVTYHDKDPGPPPDATSYAGYARVRNTHAKNTKVTFP